MFFLENNALKSSDERVLFKLVSKIEYRKGTASFYCAAWWDEDQKRCITNNVRRVGYSIVDGINKTIWTLRDINLTCSLENLQKKILVL